MAYDPGNSAEGSVAGVEVMFGGLDEWGPTSYTYVGLPETVPLPDGEPTQSVDWLNISSYLMGAPPSPRYDASMTYDGGDGYVVLFGGQAGGTGEWLGDTWTLSVIFQGETVNPPPQPPTYQFLLFGWHRVGGAGPSPRAGAGLAYDPVDNYTVLFGGVSLPTYFGDTWTYSAGVWTQLHPSPSPGAETYGGFVFDAADGYALLLPGEGGGTADWGFVHGVWTQLSPTTPLVPLPDARFGESMTYDNATGNVTVFGGGNDSPGSGYSDTWNYSSPPPGWSEVDSYGPVARSAAAMAYDPQIGCSVLFGGGGSGSSAWLNDTWILCTWPNSTAPFTVTLVPHPGISDRPEVHAGGNASFTATPMGGTWPYLFNITLRISGFHVEKDYVEHADGPISVNFTFPSSGNYLVAVVVTDTEQAIAGANLTYPVGTVMVTDWQPIRDSYPVDNSGSNWVTGGNCYGFSTTMILYWEHDILGEPETPYLPSPVWSTSQLTELPGIEPGQGPGMNGATLAITLHQTMDPANNISRGGGFGASQMAANYASLLSELEAGQPVILSLQISSGVGGGYHAVVAYGEDTLPNGTIDIDVSDPNAPETTILGVYDPTAETFYLKDPGLSTDAWEVPTDTQVSTLSTSWVSAAWTQGNSNDYDTQSQGFYFVTGLAPLTVTQTGGGEDYFMDDGSLADSQTFVQGIPNSAGIEEPNTTGTVAAFAMENHTSNTYTVTDPASGASPIQILLATNVSGTTMVRGYDLNLSSAGEHNLSLALSPGGTTLRVGGSAVSGNVSFGQLVGTVGDRLDATGVSFPADSVATFRVLNWSGLGSPTSPSVQVRLTADNGSGRTTVYSLTNGQTGLGPGSPVSYGVTFQETGLPTGTEWSVTLNGSTQHTTGATVVFDEANGTYNYSVGSTNTSYAAAGGSLTVNGSVVSRSVTFVLQTYTVSFTQIGNLPAKTLTADGWTVVLNGTRKHSFTDTILFAGLPNATYPVLIMGPSGYSVRSAALAYGSSGAYGPYRGGTLTVSGATSVLALFEKGKTATLTFSETGLPKTQTWCETVDDYEQCTTDPSLKYANLTARHNMSVPQYSTSYVCSVVSPLSGQNITVRMGKIVLPTTGILNLTGSERLTVTFAFRYSVTFTEDGLSSGTWSVTIKGATHTNGSGNPIVFNLPNGTYSYKIGTETGYTFSGVPKPVTVSGGPASVVVSFKPSGKHEPRSADLLGGASGLVPLNVGPRLAQRRSS